jgi:hypothetical protein
MLTFLTEMTSQPKNGRKSLSGGKAEAGASCEGTNDQAYNFRFVEVGEPSQGGEDSRSSIRSHVMKDYYEKKDNIRRPSTALGLSSAASQKEGVLQQTHRFKVGPDGLREVKAGRKKSKGTSRSIKKASTVGTEIPKPEDIQIRGQASLRAPPPHPPESANFASSNHWNQHIQGENFGYGQWSASESDIAIGDAQLPPQPEAGSRNVAPPENISLISGAIDPFSTLPILCVPHTEHLLHFGKLHMSIQSTLLLSCQVWMFAA